jgi:hypothetical protein
MVHIKEYGLDKKLDKLEEETLPTESGIEKENKDLLEKEAEFEKKFRLKKKKNAKRKKTRK